VISISRRSRGRQFDRDGDDGRVLGMHTGGVVMGENYNSGVRTTQEIQTRLQQWPDCSGRRSGTDSLNAHPG
jgi:hypothetical protein